MYQTEERHMPHDITYMWNLKNDTHELIYRTEQIHRHRRQIYGYQRGLQGGE